MRTKTATFADDQIVVARDSFFGALPDGQEVMVHLGQRVKASHAAVKSWPQLFVEDGSPIMPLETDVEYERPAPKDNKTRKFEFVEPYSYYTSGPASALIEYRVGDQLWENGDAWKGLSPQQRRKLLREIK